MGKKLSEKSKLKTGAYKNSNRMFFMPSKLFEAQITEIFDEVWYTVTAMKMLRWNVRGYYDEYNIQNNKRLSSKFVETEDVTNRPNLYRICIEESWGDMEFKVAKNLLVNIIACYEGWTEDIVRIFSPNSYFSKYLQYPSTCYYNYVSFLSPLMHNANSDLVSAFYNSYISNKNYNYLHLDNYLLYYRYFKECRNCIIHNGGITNQNVVNAYSSISMMTAADLDVIELPEITPNALNTPLKLTLRGVVGFSQILIKIVTTLDAECIKCEKADRYFVDIIKNLSKINNDLLNKSKSVNSNVKHGGFKNPDDVEAAYRVLHTFNVMR